MCLYWNKAAFISICILALIFSVQLYADNGFYARKAEGWFWKEPVPVVLEERVPEPEKQLPEPVAVPEDTTAPVASTPFSAAWMREKLPEYRDIALENPSPENVRAYFYLQRYAMDMAERFAMTAQKVVLSDAVLDENNRRSLSTYGARVIDDHAKQATFDLAQKISAQAGIWYFYSSDCPYCEAQNPVLKRLQRRLDLAVLPIALDGKAMPDSSYPDFVPDRGHAKNLNVSATPTLYLVKAPDQFILLSEGLTTDNSLMQRMILAAHGAGWISDEEINKTRGTVQPTQLYVDTKEMSDDVLADPVRLVEMLQSTLIQPEL